MKVICAWCNKDIGEKPGEGVSHGMCLPCAERMQTQAKHHRRALGWVVDAKDVHEAKAAARAALRIGGNTGTAKSTK